MKRKLIAALLALTISVSVTGCGKDKVASNDTATTETAAVDSSDDATTVKDTVENDNTDEPTNAPADVALNPETYEEVAPSEDTIISYSENDDKLVDADPNQFWIDENTFDYREGYIPRGSAASA